MKSSIYNLFHNWHMMRWLRLILGIAFLIQAIYIQNTFSALIAVFVLFHAATNAGCCNSNSCNTPLKKINDK